MRLIESLEGFFVRHSTKMFIYRERDHLTVSYHKRDDETLVYHADNVTEVFREILRRSQVPFSEGDDPELFRELDAVLKEGDVHSVVIMTNPNATYTATMKDQYRLVIFRGPIIGSFGDNTAKYPVILNSTADTIRKALSWAIVRRLHGDDEPTMPGIESPPSPPVMPGLGVVDRDPPLQPIMPGLDIVDRDPPSQPAMPGALSTRMPGI
jgi:hypothetical protein